MRIRLLPLLSLCFFVAACGEEETVAPGTVQTKNVTYRDGDTELEGYLAFPAGRDNRPGVLVVHEWWGIAEHPKERARALAKMGYVAFVADMYGKGKLTNDPKQAGAWASEFRDDPHGFGRRRIRAGYDVLAKQDAVDPKRISAIGFCYGGSVALELAYAGADLRAVVAFHAQPITPREEDVPNVKAALLVCHGADDPLVPAEAVAKFKDTLGKTEIEWEFKAYEGAVHAFTNPNADAHGLEPVKYHEEAAKQAWADMSAFFGQHVYR